MKTLITFITFIVLNTALQASGGDIYASLHTAEAASRKAMRLPDGSATTQVVRDAIAAVAARHADARITINSATRSMEPLLHEHHLIVIAQADFETIAVGDIIAFQSRTIRDGDSIAAITHRVVERTRSTLRTRGDNAPDARLDPDRTTKKSLVGRVVAAIDTRSGETIHF